MEVPEAAAAHQALVDRHQAAAVTAGRRAWDQVNPDDLNRSWAQKTQVLERVVSGQQLAAAQDSADYVPRSLAQVGQYVVPDNFLDPAGFAGVAADGRRLDTLLYSPVTTTRTALQAGANMADALQAGRAALDTIVSATVADAGRAAAGVNIAARAGVGYVRHLNSGACDRCAVLAGKWFRWNQGFNRHPHCYCVHVPVLETDQAAKEGLTTDPYEYFRSLSPADQERRFGKAGAAAIRDGADLFQVVNSRRGMLPGGLTREGTSRAGNFRRMTGSTRRLTPEAIYGQQLGREETLELLRSNGYLLPGGQDPLGVIIGQREGWGALGRGGTRVGARNAVEQARATGVRDPNVRATMTAQERRMHDAHAQWQDVLAGRNPYGRGPLTPEIGARAEARYRAALDEVRKPTWQAPAPAPVTVSAAPVATPPQPTPQTGTGPLRPAQPTTADTLTYDSTLHWSDDKLMDSIAEYADDPEAVDRILEIIDQREAAAVVKAAEREQLQDAWARQEAKDRAEIEARQAAAGSKPTAPRELTANQRTAQEYDEYVANQYSQAMEVTNGNFFNLKNQHLAKQKGIDSYALFTGPYRIASKYASEELQEFWRKYGRETLGSYRYQVLRRPTDRAAAELVQRLGFNTGRNAVANRADRIGL